MQHDLKRRLNEMEARIDEARARLVDARLHLVEAPLEVVLHVEQAELVDERDLADLVACGPARARVPTPGRPVPFAAPAGALRGRAPLDGGLCPGNPFNFAST